MKHPKKSEEFFEEMSERSEVKTEIVRKYFWAWAKIISRQVKKYGGSKIAFVDLFAGKGRYDDGTPSTPILILERAIQEPVFSEMLQAFFNDANLDNVRALEAAIEAVTGIEKLKYKPVVRNHRVDDDLAAKLANWKIPALFFLDPFGYKGLSLKLIEAALRPWGCDCIFFFNYVRINAALSNRKFTANMNAFFGKERADKLRSKIAGATPEERQTLIIEELKRALTELGGKYNIEYFFKDEGGHKTSYFIIFTSKNVKAYEIMKEIMGRESSLLDHGVPTFGFDPSHKGRLEEKERTPTLFDMDADPIDHLAEMLLMFFAGRTLTMLEIYREHHVGKRYLLQNYRDALKRLDAEGRILTDPPAAERRQGTFGENIKVTFPAEEEI
ncbi:MAG TPA: three-Cys-motif partner protein TcmP [Pyrinomonadaceae bacterium]